jgi:hypothetical protein
MGVRSWVVLGAFMAAPLSGCPGGADLDDPDRFPALQADTAGAAGSSGGAGTAGSAGTAGMAGSSGVGGRITFVPPDCDYRGVLSSQCGRGTCHQKTPNNPTSPLAGLDLVADGIEERLYGKRPTYKDMTCPNPDGGLVPVACVPPGCSQDAYLIAPGNPTGSFMYQKIAGSHGDCGRVMPLAPGTLNDTTRACLEDWIEAVANATVTP